MHIQKREPSHPGKILKNLYLEPLSLTISDLAKKLHVSRKTLSQLINGRAGISPDMALRLSQAFDTSPQLWMNLQQTYDLWHQSHSRTWKKIHKIAA